MTAEHTDTHSEAQGPSFARLAARALDQMRGLMRREVDMARAELDESLSDVGAAVALAASAMVIALAALNVLAGALVAALAELGLEPGWAALVVGLALALVAGGMAMRAMKDLKSASLAPKRTADRLQADAEAVKEGLNG